MRNEAWRISIYEATFPGNTDGGEDVISCAHDSAYTGLSQLSDNRCSCVLQLIFKDNEAQEAETGFCLFPRYFLYLPPA